MLVWNRVQVRRCSVAPVTRRRCDLTPEAQPSEEEEPDPVRTFAQLRRLGLGLVTIGHQNFASAVPCVPHPPTHAQDPTQLASAEPPHRVAESSVRPARARHVECGP